MKRIERTGRDTHHAECRECGCKFTYQREDVQTDYARGTRRVSCPECGNPIFHFGASGSKWPVRAGWLASACAAVLLALLAAAPARADGLVWDISDTLKGSPVGMITGYQLNLKTLDFRRGVALGAGYGLRWTGWQLPLGVAVVGGAGAESNDGTLEGSLQGNLLFVVADNFGIAIGGKFFQGPPTLDKPDRPGPVVVQGLLSFVLTGSWAATVEQLGKAKATARAAGMVEGAKAVRP